MVAILQAVSTGGGGGGGSSATARNHRGQASAIPANTTATLVSFTAVDFRLRGFVVTGTTDFIAWIEVDSVPLEGIQARGSIVKIAQVILPNPEDYPSPTALVALRVRNENQFGTTGDFEGTLLGE